MSKQTVVEWLKKELEEYGSPSHLSLDWETFDELIDQAKAMEKQQSIYDYCEGFKASGEGWNGEYGLDNILDVAGEIDAEQYYINTYKDYCKDCKPGDEQ